MSTTLLERTNPLEQLRPPAASEPGRARRVLAELDAEVTGIFQALEPRPTLRGRIVSPKRILRKIMAPRPSISVHRVPRSGPAQPTEMPRSLTWLPMLRGAVNAQLDSTWRAWLSTWDRVIVTQRRLCQAKTEAVGVAFRIKEEILAEKTVRTIEYFTRAVWEDYLSVFGAVEGTRGAHIMRELGQLDLLV